jgi:crossover junction endodeoxyribonuclease RusA
LTLPFPPSVNTYWRHPTTGKLAGRHLISDKGRKYRDAVTALAAEGRYKTMTGPLVVDLEVFMPDKRRRDLDNLTKAIFDSLTHAGVWEDDSQIVDFRVWKNPAIGGMVKVTIEPWHESTTVQSLIARLRTLTDDMIDIGASMDYFGGLNAEIVQHGRELIGASAMVEAWADGLEDDHA